MITINNYSDNKTLSKNNFTSRSKTLREIDDICRTVIKEFPAISDSKLRGYNSLDKNRHAKTYRQYIGQSIATIRDYYSKSNDSKKNLLIELDGMKRFKMGNCSELSDATLTSLKMNGYKNTEIMWLYAYNPKTNKMRDIDHSVVGINFPKPDNYEYCPLYQMYWNTPDVKYRLYAKNTGIIVDAWAGITDYGKNLRDTYNTNQALIRCANENAKTEGQPLRKTLLSPDEELCFVPLSSKRDFSDEFLSYLSETHQHLLLPKNQKAYSQVKIVNSKTYSFTPMSPHIISEIKTKYKLNNSLSNDELLQQSQQRVSNMLKKNGYITESSDKKNNKLSIKDWIKKIF